MKSSCKQLLALISDSDTTLVGLPNLKSPLYLSSLVSNYSATTQSVIRINQHFTAHCASGQKT